MLMTTVEATVAINMTVVCPVSWLGLAVCLLITIIIIITILHNYYRGCCYGGCMLNIYFCWNHFLTKFPPSLSPTLT